MRTVEKAGSGLAPRLTWTRTSLALVESTTAEANKVHMVWNRSAGTFNDATRLISPHVLSVRQHWPVAGQMARRCSRRLRQRVVCVRVRVCVQTGSKV